MKYQIVLFFFALLAVVFCEEELHRVKRMYYGGYGMGMPYGGMGYGGYGMGGYGMGYGRMRGYGYGMGMPYGGMGMYG